MKQIQYLLLSILLGLNACKSSTKEQQLEITSVAQSEKQWTGVAVSREGRVFVNYPNWSSNVPVSVAEIINGVPRAYPDMSWNQRTGKHSFNAVQSVFVDKKNRLWVLDTNNAQFKGVAEEGPVLYAFNLEDNNLIQAYHFSQETYASNSYFNDVRIDTKKEIAYMTDSGDGALIILDLNSGKARRVLDEHVSVKSEKDHLVCDGVRWENSVDSDGIALSPDRSYLYYIALTSHTLYRIPTEALLDEQLSEKDLAKQVEKVKKVPATDGMLFDKAGNLYMGGLETNAVNRLTPDGDVETVIQDPQIRWADSFALDQDGNLYFTTSQIHLPDNKRELYEVIKIKPTN
jgi:sugar lactone lactonase YvrE